MLDKVVEFDHFKYMRTAINTTQGVAQCILATCYKDGIRNILLAGEYNRTAVMNIYDTDKNMRNERERPDSPRSQDKE